MIPRRAVKIKFFLSVVIYVVKGDFVPLSASGKIPQMQASQGFAAFHLTPVPDTDTALPNQALYQMSYTSVHLLLGYAAAHLCYFNISGRVCQADDLAGNCGAPSALMHTQRKTPPLWLTPGRWYSLGAKISPGTAGWTGSGHRYPAARLRWSCLRSPGAWPAARPPKRLHRS